jgi:vacuolar iron transporter family protein
MPGVHLMHRELHLGWPLELAARRRHGANYGIVSTASLVLGVAASGAATAVVTAGIAGLVAGALSMAAGAYVSVSSQRDTERADLELEAREIGADPEGEERELARIYERRGLPSALAREVAVALSEHDALGAHARDELGL